jgi:Tfp pilus assembly protein PilO
MEKYKDLILFFIKKYKNIIISVGIIFVFYLIITNIYKSYRERMKSIRAEIKEWEDKIPLSRKILDVEAKFNQINANLLDNFLKFRQLIEKIADQNEIEIQSLRPSSKYQEESFLEMEIELVARGSYSHFTNFMEALDKYSSIGLKELKINRSSGGDRDSDNLKIRLKIAGLIKKGQ